MKTITKIDAVQLAIGLQNILLDMAKKQNLHPSDAKYPVLLFEEMIIDQKNVSKKDAELVTERVINTGILRWDIMANCFIL